MKSIFLLFLYSVLWAGTISAQYTKSNPIDNTPLYFPTVGIDIGFLNTPGIVVPSIGIDSYFVHCGISYKETNTFIKFVSYEVGANIPLYSQVLVTPKYMWNTIRGQNLPFKSVPAVGIDFKLYNKQWDDYQDGAYIRVGISKYIDCDALQFNIGIGIYSRQ
jgi:hypothetical protein